MFNFRVNITYVDRDGETHDIKGKVGDNVMYLAHRHDVEIEGKLRALTPGALCFKLLCVVGLKDRLFNFSQISVNFMSHDG